MNFVDKESRGTGRVNGARNSLVVVDNGYYVGASIVAGEVFWVQFYVFGKF